MRFPSLLAVAAACALAPLAAPSVSRAAVPPDRQDPCSSAGRDTCGTLGVGFYEVYRYGARWFGDYRGAVPGEAHTFCIDLRFWYASPAYRYRRVSPAALRNRDGEAVPVESQRRMAYALWSYGRSTSPNQQAAVMLYVHLLMGDARAGELDPGAVNATVVSVYREITRAAGRYHGPYRIETRIRGGLTVARRATATVRVLSARGFALPHVRLILSARGASGLPRQVQTNGAGSVRVALTPIAADLRVSVATEQLASSWPAFFGPTTTAAARSGQRLAAPASQRVSASLPLRARPSLTSAISAEVVHPGSRIFDRIRAQGLGSTEAALQVELYGPFASRSAISCTGRPYWTGRITARGEGAIRSPSVKVGKVGYYTYRERLIGSPSVPGATTDCPLAAETTLSAPRIVAGRGEIADDVDAADAAGRTPVRVRVAALGIDAPVKPVGIDLAHGVLAVPSNIGRAGWWRDGTAPGASSGAILIAGHVDSAHAGLGVFFKLHRAKAGDRVRLTTADGRSYVYRVVSVRDYRKSALPTSVYSQHGAPRLVLVTCGGPFDPTKRHYRDNVVLTAVPV
jgi:LPXTG-site transpeptidase (sortase) family protein